MSDTMSFASPEWRRFPLRPRIKNGIKIVRLGAKRLLVIGGHRDVLLQDEVASNAFEIIKFLDGTRDVGALEASLPSIKGPQIVHVLHELDSRGLLTSGEKAKTEASPAILQFADRVRGDDTLDLQSARRLRSPRVELNCPFDWVEEFRGKLTTAGVGVELNRHPPNLDKLVCAATAKVPRLRCVIALFLPYEQEDTSAPYVLVEELRDSDVHQSAEPSRLLRMTLGSADQCLPIAATLAVVSHWVLLGMARMPIVDDLGYTRSYLRRPAKTVRPLIKLHRDGTPPNALNELCRYATGYSHNHDGDHHIAPTAGDSRDIQVICIRRLPGQEYDDLYYFDSSTSQLIRYRSAKPPLGPVDHGVQQGEWVIALVARTTWLRETYGSSKAGRLAAYDGGFAIEHIFRASRALGFRAKYIRGLNGPEVLTALGLNRSGEQNQFIGCVEITPQPSSPSGGADQDLCLMLERRSVRRFASGRLFREAAQIEHAIGAGHYNSWPWNDFGLDLRLRRAMRLDGHTEISEIALGTGASRLISKVGAAHIHNLVFQPELAEAPLIYFVESEAGNPATHVGAAALCGALWCEARRIGLAGVPYGDLDHLGCPSIESRESIALCIGMAGLDHVAN